MENSVLLYSPKITNRLRYAADFVFERILGVRVNYTSDTAEAEAASVPLIVYADEDRNGIRIPSSGLLFETGIRPLNPGITLWKNTTALFSVDHHSGIPFDLFSAVFFLLSRYEEYSGIARDAHGRPLAADSFMGRNNLLHLPLADQWAFALAGAIQEKYPEWKPATREYKYIPTIDVDNAFAYLNKGFYRTAGALAKHLFKGNFSEIKKRLRVLQYKEPDPYDTYSRIYAIHTGSDVKAVYFFLFSRYGKYDRGCPVQNVGFRRLIARINDYGEIGIHPSYTTPENPKRMHEEIRRMSTFLEEPVRCSRQHFLRLKLPETYTELVSNKILNDFSMGFADHTGFRSGTCTPHLFYDLEIETPVNLKLYPLAVMDTSLMRYMKLSPEEALTHCKKIHEEVKKVNGTMVTLWHNESLSGTGDWKGWEEIYPQVVRTFAAS